MYSVNDFICIKANSVSFFPFKGYVFIWKQKRSGLHMQLFCQVSFLEMGKSDM